MCWIAYWHINDIKPDVVLENQKDRWLHSISIFDCNTWNIYYAHLDLLSEYKNFIKKEVTITGRYFMHHRKASVGDVNLDNQHPFVWKKFLISQNGTSKEFYEKHKKEFPSDVDTWTLLQYLEANCDTLEECITELDLIDDIVWTVFIHTKDKTLIYSDSTRCTNIITSEVWKKKKIRYLDSITNYKPNSIIGYRNWFNMIIENKTSKIISESYYNEINTLHNPAYIMTNVHKIGKFYEYPKKIYQPTVIQRYGTNNHKSSMKVTNTSIVTKKPFSSINDVEEVYSKLPKELLKDWLSKQDFFVTANYIPDFFLLWFNHKTQYNLVKMLFYLDTNYSIWLLNQIKYQVNQIYPASTFSTNDLLYSRWGIPKQLFNDNYLLLFQKWQNNKTIRKKYTINPYRFTVLLYNLYINWKKNNSSDFDKIYSEYLNKLYQDIIDFCDNSELSLTTDVQDIHYDIATYMTSNWFFTYSFDWMNYINHKKQYDKICEEFDKEDADEVLISEALNQADELYYSLEEARNYIIISWLLGFDDRTSVDKKTIEYILLN